MSEAQGANADAVRSGKNSDAKDGGEPSSGGTFLESLVVDLKVAGVQVPGANVKRLELHMLPYGFSGTVEFWLRGDPAADPSASLHETIIGTDSLTIELAVSKLHYLGEKTAPLQIAGLVGSRSFGEIVGTGVATHPILFRRYRLTFTDPACALWSQHRPSIVYGKTALEAVLAEHTPSSIALTKSWSVLRTKRPIVCLALGEDSASFYDWLAWFVDTSDGHFVYDYEGASYGLADEKPAARSPASWPAAASGELTVILPDPARHSVNLLNSFGDATGTTAVESAYAINGVRRDYLLHTPLSTEVTSRKTLEKKRITLGKPEIHVQCRLFPEVHPAPNSAVELDREEFSARVFGYGRTFRTTEVHLEARAKDESPESDIDLDDTEYRVSLSYRFESADDVTRRLPPYRTPRYPMWVEGRVVSSLGEDGDRTHLIYEDEETSRDYYQVRLPVWNVEIRVPFLPQFHPGHLYFPAYRDSRVMLAIGFDAAQIHAFLDWGDAVRLPVASQGNQILFGKNGTSETGLKHWYVASKPELEILRKHQGDVGTMTVRDGTIVIETFDDESAATASTTESLASEAATSKAQMQTQAEAAMSDVQGAGDQAAQSLRGGAGAAASAVQSDAGGLKVQVQTKVDDTNTALGTLAADTETDKAKVRDAVTDARMRIRKIFEGE
jgi:hypothetical protein